MQVIGEYVRQSEEDPAKVLEALKEAERTLANGTYPEFSLKVCTGLGVSNLRTITKSVRYYGPWRYP